MTSSLKLSYLTMSVVSGGEYSHTSLNLIKWDTSHTQDVLVSQQDSVVDFSLSEPRLFISGGKYFDGNTLPLPLAPPHFAVTALT